MNIRKSSLKTSLNIFKPWIATFHGAFAWNCAPLVANQLGHRPLVEAPVPSWKIQELRRWINQKPFGQSSPFRIWINSYHEYPWIFRPIYKSCTNELGQCKQKRSKACLAQPFLWSAGGKSPRTRNSADLVHLVHFCSKWQTQIGKNREQTNTLSDCLLEGCVAQL